MRLAAGIDIGGSKVLAVAIDPGGAVVATTRLRSSGGADGVIDSAVTAVTSLAERAGVGPADFAVVGVGVPGVVQTHSGEVSHAVNLGVGADGVSLGGLLGARLGVPVVVENDVNAAALGASRLLGLDRTDLAFLSIGTGLAAGLVSRGVLRRGSRGAAGEIGHVPVDPAGPLCRCGQRGCLEMLASGSAIAVAWPAQGGRSAAESLFGAAETGDPTAVRVRDAVAGHLASAVRLLVLTCDVEIVVLGGGVTDVGTALLTAVREALVRQAAGSSFLASLELPDRIASVPAGSTVAAVGAALAGRAAVPPAAGARLVDSAVESTAGPVPA